MDFASIKALLRGPRLGREDTTMLSVLVKQASSLARYPEITSQADVELYNQLYHTSNELRLGGSCKHGADKGKKCRRCVGGVLEGRYALLPDGLEVAEYGTRLLSDKQMEKLNADIERVNSALREVDTKLKSVKQRVDEFKKRQNKKSKPTVVAAQSISEIKKKSGVVFNSAATQMKHTIHVCGKMGGKTIPLEVNLEEEEEQGGLDLLNKLYMEIERKQLECFGRRVSVKALVSPRDTRLGEDLSAFFDDYEHQDGDVFRFEASAIEHESLPICYSKACKTIGVDIIPLLLGALSTQQASTSINLARKSYALDASLFEALRYNCTLTQLNLSGTMFDLKEHCNTIGTVVNLQGLYIAASRNATCDLQDLCIALDVWKNCLLQLHELDISNWRMVESNSLSAFIPAFLCFMKKHVGLKQLKMNRCFYVTAHSFLSDDDVENATSFYVEALAPALHERALELFEFESNVFFEHDDDDLLRAMFSQQHGTTLSLACCRTWLENEIDNHAVMDSFQWRKPITCSLTALNLSQCKLGDAGLLNLLRGGEFAHLQTLNLGSIGAGTLGLATLCQQIAQDKFPSLKMLVISGNDKDAFAGPNANALAGLANITGEIHMQGFRGIQTNEFSPLVRLTKLTITRFDDDDDNAALDCCHLFDYVLPGLQELTVHFTGTYWTINHPKAKQRMMGEVVFSRT